MRKDLTNRRAVLAGLGVAGAGVLAGCSSDKTASPAVTSSAPQASVSDLVATSSAPAVTSSAPVATSSAPVATSEAPVETSTAPVATSAAPVPSSAAPAASGFTVAKSKVPVGTGVYFSDDAVIITQPTAGKFKAFSSVCTHQGCPVTGFTGGKLVCPCHGSEYSITDGSVLQGPAQKALTPKTVTVDGANVVVKK